VSTYQNDGLHPDTAGYKKMGESIDLNLFVGELSTGINEKSQNLPDTFSLLQNYPNPFNPTTTISFGLPVKSYVSLKIFDYLGRGIAIIVSEEMLAGSYSKQWNASNMASGIYFYRLQAGSFTETKKLVLLR
jgi:hypothetical protein